MPRALTRFIAPIWAFAVLTAGTAYASGPWRWTVSIEGGRPSGWVQVRENALAGTRLHFADDLNLHRMSGIQMGARKTLGASTEWQLSLASYALKGGTVLMRPVNFNGTTIALGALRTVTGLPHFLRFDTSWWRRFAGSADRASLSGGVGLALVLLKFRLHGTVAPHSVGDETKEDFDTQEFRYRYWACTFRIRSVAA